MDFDGVDDRLVLSAVPFQMSDDHFVVAGVARLGGGASSSTIYGIGSGSDTQRAPTVAINASNQPAAAWRGDDTVLASVNNTAVTLGQVVVVGARKQGINKSVRTNAVQGTVNTTVVGAATTDRSVIGMLPATGGYMNGPIYALALGKGTITDAQLALVERFIASQSGVTI
jgi:hypothetical protein